MPTWQIATRNPFKTFHCHPCQGGIRWTYKRDYMWRDTKKSINWGKIPKMGRGGAEVPERWEWEIFERKHQKYSL